MSTTIDCIYCREDKPESAYTKPEHVLPRSFGGFKNNMTLTRLVCDDCNQFFGDCLEIALGRDTVEGQSRVDFGVRRPAEFRSPGPNSRMRIRVAEGPFRGADAFREYSDDARAVVLSPVPQVGFRGKRTGHYIYFSLDGLPAKGDLDELGVDLRHPESIRAFGVSVDELSRTLAEKGIPFREGGNLPPSQDTESVLCEIESTIDKTVQRAAAKIAFNYLAYWEKGEFARQPQFDLIRNFVRRGEDGLYPLVHVSNESVLADEGGRSDRRLGHVVTLNWASDGVSIVAQVSLLATFKYSVCLARGYEGERREISRGHFFNVADGQILELCRPETK